ncbi:MAG: GNAT family N-acetyltransferase [Nocardioides sp.]
MADVSVRVAGAEDSAAVARVQTRAWARLALDPVTTAAAWHASLSRPADARNRVLVGLDRNTVVGFAVVIPAADPDRDPARWGEIVELLVDPDHRSAGHGSRLLQAAVDTMVADGFSRAVTWVEAADDRRRRFLTEAGWQPDGAHRELAGDRPAGATPTLRQIRLQTAIA